MSRNITGLDELIEALANATTAGDLFPQDPAADYRRLAKLCHPDRFAPGPRQDVARRAFVQLTAWHDQATNGTPPRIVTSPQRRYAIQSLLGRGDLADVYLATADGTDYVLKVCRPNGGNSLLLSEFRKLRKLADRAGTFYLRSANATGYADSFFEYEASGDQLPISGNWDGSGGDSNRPLHSVNRRVSPAKHQLSGIGRCHIRIRRIGLRLDSTRGRLGRRRKRHSRGAGSKEWNVLLQRQE